MNLLFLTIQERIRYKDIPLFRLRCNSEACLPGERFLTPDAEELSMACPRW
jgi:hypothetical protein